MTDLIEQVARRIEAELCTEAGRTVGAIWASERGREQMLIAAKTAVAVMSDRIAQLEAENTRLIADRAQWVEPARMVLGKQHGPD